MMIKKLPNNKALLLYRVRVSNTRFSTIPEPERILFIRFGHCIDEINTLLRIFLWSTPSEKLQKEEMNARLAQGLVIVRVLTGKLNEAYKLIDRDYFGGAISKKYNSLLDDSARNAVQNLRRYFSKTNLINTLRNQYSFHYLDKFNKVVKCLKKVPSEDDLIFYFAEDSRNSFYCSADVILRNAMLEDIEPDCPDQAQERLEKETVIVTGWLLTFLNWYMYTVMTQNLGKNFEEMGAKEIMIQKPPKDTDIELPYFVSFENK